MWISIDANLDHPRTSFGSRLTGTPAVHRMHRFLRGCCVAGAALAASVAAFASTGAADAPGVAPAWVGTWSASPQPAFAGQPERYAQQTLRLIVHTSIGGPQLRIRLANTYGDAPLVIGAAHLARRTVDSQVDPTTDRTLTFGGRATVTVPPHGAITSDPVALDVPALTDLAVSLYLPQPTTASTTHVLAMQTSYVAPGDATAAQAFPKGSTIDGWPFLAGIDVAAPAAAGAVVAFGDSIVDGDGSSTDANRRWTDVLALRLLPRQPGQPGLGVLNQGIIGNRLLAGSPAGKQNPAGAALGEAALARFERDVLQQAGVKAVILRFGTNDIGLPGSLAPASEAVSAGQLIAGYTALVARARQRGLAVVGMTLSPFEHAKMPRPGYYTARKEQVRRQLNEWMRTSGQFDAVVDTDALLRDPQRPSRLLPQYDSGDHLHPNDAGYAAIAAAVPVELLRQAATARR